MLSGFPSHAIIEESSLYCKNRDRLKYIWVKARNLYFSKKQEIFDILNACNPKPRTPFRIAIESEYCLLADRNAVKAACPRAKDIVLNAYVPDSICVTWEKLADAICPGGSQKLKQQGWPHTGQAKCEWAKSISPHLDVESH